MAGFVRCAARITLVNGNAVAKLLSKQTAASGPQVACISSKAWRDLNGIKRPPPYDYKNKLYENRHTYFDPTMSRIDENSKIICVEGPIASGKTKFAKELAEKLDMYHMPQATMDDIYINPYGYDLRELDDQLPPGAKSFDEKKFLANPNDRLVAAFQIQMYQLKVSDYIDSLAHLFSTGQGVVIERSAFSDFVFNEALYRCGYITKTSYKGISDSHRDGNWFLFKPHLVIYLDVPIDVTMQNIKKRNLWNEASSPVFKDNKFLEIMEDTYKRDFLKDINTHSELLVYDWSNGGEVDLVVDDIEQIDFDAYEHYEEKMKGWRELRGNPEWNDARIDFTTNRHITFSYCQLPLFHCPDLTIEPEDDKIRNELYEQAKGSKYAYGYNEELGDKSILTKTKHFNNPNYKHWEF